MLIQAKAHLVATKRLLTRTGLHLSELNFEAHDLDSLIAFGNVEVANHHIVITRGDIAVRHKIEKAQRRSLRAIRIYDFGAQNLRSAARKEHGHTGVNKLNKTFAIRLQQLDGVYLLRLRHAAQQDQ